MSDVKQRVYIGLGSNLEDPARQISHAVDALKVLPESRYLKDSGLYLSKPLQLPEDDSEMPDYFNAVVLIETTLEPLELLDLLQSIETQQGRVRNTRWGARTLDLDILMYGDLQLDTERLKIPHPEMVNRGFVLYPLQNIEEDLDIPGRGKLSRCIENCSGDGLQYLGSIGDTE